MNHDQKKVGTDAGRGGMRRMDQTSDSIYKAQPAPSPSSEPLFSPLRFLIITIGGIFLAEIGAMAVVYFIRSVPYYLQTIIDATIMVLMIFPLVYNLSLKPLIRNVEEHRKAEESLRQSEERFSKAFHFGPSASSITHSKDGTFLDVNERFLELFGYAREEVIGRTALDLNLYLNPQAREEIVLKLSLHGVVRGFETKGKTSSGEIRHFSMSVQAIELDGEACLLSNIIDVTERRRDEARLRRVNHALSVLNECNQLLVRAENETELLQSMCEIIVNVGEYRMAWVGMAEQDQARTVRPIAQFGFEEGYLDRAHITWADDEYGRGPTGTAIRESVIQVNQNFLTNPKMAPWRESAISRGYQSSIALPLQTEGAIFGALTIYSASPEAFDEEEVHLLRELAGDLAFGMTALHDRIERKRAEERVREMALFPTLNPNAVLQVDVTGHIKTVNPVAAQLGLRAGTRLTELVPDLRDLDLANCIHNGTMQQISDTQLGYRDLLWTIKGAPELGLAFLYSTDITERKQAEGVIRQLSRIVEQTEDTVVVTNCDGMIEYVNPAFERQTGYTRQEAVGKTPRVIKSGIHDGEFYKNLWHTILRGDVFQSEIANCRKNGELFYEVKTITPLRDIQGNITHFVATGKDITEHKRDEEKLQTAYEELEIRVEERTEELRIANSELEDEIHIRRRAEAEAQRYAQELSTKNEELTRFNRAMVGRELRMIGLKKEVNELCGRAGQPARYSLDFEKE